MVRIIVKDTWFSRLLEKLNRKKWVTIIWFLICPFLIIGPIDIIREIDLRTNAFFSYARVVEYKIKGGRNGRVGKISYLYEYNNEYYTNTCTVNAAGVYNINDTIPIIINAQRPEQSHIWLNKHDK